MNRSVLLCGLAFASLLMGRYQHNRVEAALIPASCPKYKCVQFYAWWDGNGAPTVKAMYDPLTGGVVNVGSTDMFTLISGFKDPIQILGVGGNLYDFPACFPHCGFEPGTLKWQAPQTVNPAGARGPVPAFLTPYTQCTPANDIGADGNPLPAPQSDDQSTQPVPGTPPGVMTEELPVTGD